LFHKSSAHLKATFIPRLNKLKLSKITLTKLRDEFGLITYISYAYVSDALIYGIASIARITNPFNSTPSSQLLPLYFQTLAVLAKLQPPA